MSRSSKPGRETRPPPRKVRIIGGAWRGRRLPVLAAPALRPTPDRVRETLFNWLQPYIEGASCLDLFAGSGALGFEAASRGAGRVVMLEEQAALVKNLREQALVLGAQGVRIEQRNGLDWVATAPPEEFDIVFLDPPFGRDLVGRACDSLLQHERLSEGALVYVESEAGLAMGGAALQKFKQGKAGQVQYGLLQYHREAIS